MVEPAIPAEDMQSMDQLKAKLPGFLQAAPKYGMVSVGDNVTNL